MSYSICYIKILKYDTIQAQYQNKASIRDLAPTTRYYVMCKKTPKSAMLALSAKKVSSLLDAGNIINNNLTVS